MVVIKNSSLITSLILKIKAESITHLLNHSYPLKMLRNLCLSWMVMLKPVKITTLWKIASLTSLRSILVFSLQTKKKVTLIIINMYPPYMKLIKTLFPNSKIILDKFYVTKLLSGALNKTCVLMMKSHKDHYNKLNFY